MTFLRQVLMGMIAGLKALLQQGFPAHFKRRFSRFHKLLQNSPILTQYIVNISDEIVLITVLPVIKMITASIITEFFICTAF